MAAGAAAGWGLYYQPSLEGRDGASLHTRHSPCDSAATLFRVQAAAVWTRSTVLTMLHRPRHAALIKTWRRRGRRRPTRKSLVRMNLLYLLLCYAIIKTEDGAAQKEMMVFTQRRARGR